MFPPECAATIGSMTDTGFDRLLPLEGATNFRDLGGYTGRDGRRVRWRRVFRSDHLGGLTEADRRTLAALGLGSAIDFRGAHEGAAQPYALPGVRRLALSIEPSVVQRMDELAAAGRPRDAAMAADAMRDLYLRLVDEQQHRFAAFFSHLLEDEAPLVFHCTAGKDRTGVAAALLLLALGVHPDDVLQDFLLTNRHYVPPVAPNALWPADVLGVLWAVQESFLQTALDRIEHAHGGIDRYLAERLGVDAAARERLAARLLA